MCTLLMNKAERDDYWLRFWEETAQAEHPAKANGRSSASAAEFFYLLADICAKLEFSGESSLLDIGCGSGHVLQMLAPWVRYAVGVDYAQGQVKNAARHLLKFPHVEVRQANVLALPFPEGTFDRVLCWSVLQYLPDREQVQTALREVARVLAPGGRALVAGNPDISTKRTTYRVSPGWIARQNRRRCCAPATNACSGWPRRRWPTWPVGPAWQPKSVRWTP